MVWPLQLCPLPLPNRSCDEHLSLNCFKIMPLPSPLYRCEPVYVQYQFPTQAPFRTEGLPHNPSISFNSPNVILLGTLDQNILLEHIRGPPLVIEVHDRDIKLELEGTSKALFGLESQDDLIGTHAFSSNLTRGGPGRIYNSPYGTASVDLGVLLNGQLSMELTVPVVKGPRSNPEASTVKSDAMVRVKSEQVYPGDYLDSGCELTIRMELSHQLSFLNAHQVRPFPSGCLVINTIVWRMLSRTESKKQISDSVFLLFRCQSFWRNPLKSTPLGRRRFERPFPKQNHSLPWPHARATVWGLWCPL